MQLIDSMGISASGMKAQGERLRVISENMANADSTGSTPGSDPYRRKTISFKSVLDKELGGEIVQTDQISVDRVNDFQLKFMPDSPAANADGYVKMPNVNTLVEMVDMREAQRSYEANLGMISLAKNMANQTLDLLHG